MDASKMATWKPINDSAKQQFLRAQVFRMWNVPNAFSSPCPLPVSVSAADLATLSHQHYVVAPKQDGTRYLLVLTQFPRGVNVAVLVSRSWLMYPIVVCAPSVHYREGSLFDGELVWEPMVESSPIKRALFYVFDVVCVAGDRVTDKPYSERHAILTQLFFDQPHMDLESYYDPAKWRNVIAPTIVRQTRRLVPCCNAGYLGFRAKAWRRVQDVGAALDDMRSMVADGLVFMPVRDPVSRVRLHTRMFKWKTRHTIDLKACKRADKSVQLRHYCPIRATDVEGAVGRLQLHVAGDTLGIPTEERVCEFLIEIAQDGCADVYLQFLAVRTDKDNANSARTILATVDNFIHPVTEAQLVAACTANTHPDM